MRTIKFLFVWTMKFIVSVIQDFESGVYFARKRAQAVEFLRFNAEKVLIDARDIFEGTAVKALTATERGADHLRVFSHTSTFRSFVLPLALFWFLFYYL